MDQEGWNKELVRRLTTGDVDMVTTWYDNLNEEDRNHVNVALDALVGFFNRLFIEIKDLLEDSIGC